MPSFCACFVYSGFPLALSPPKRTLDSVSFRLITPTSFLFLEADKKRRIGATLTRILYSLRYYPTRNATGTMSDLVRVCTSVEYTHIVSFSFSFRMLLFIHTAVIIKNVVGITFIFLFNNYFYRFCFI